MPPSTTTRLLNSVLHGNESRESTPGANRVVTASADSSAPVGTVVVSGTNHQSGAFASGITPAADSYSAVPRMAWDGIHLASPTATNGQSLLGRTVVAHSLATNPIGMGATPPTDWDNELLTANANSSTVVPSESGCDDWRDSDSDQLPDWYETHIAALSARDGLNSVNELTPSLVLWGSLWQGTPVTVLQVLQFGGDPGLPLNAQGDFDSDGLNDFFERLAGTDPRKYDTDDDGMGDGWELRHGLDPNSGVGPNGGAADLDNDGLSNLDESRHGTDPDEADTDGDSAPPPFGSGGNRNDGQEVGRGLDPLKRNDPDEPDMRRKVRFRVGDPSDSDSERYIFRIRGTGPDGRQLVWMNTTTDVENFEWILHRGSSYIIDLLHRKTRLATPDYDYQVQIRSDTTTGWITGTNWRGAPAGEPEFHVVSLNTLPDNTTGSTAAWVADNREHVLGQHSTGNFHNQDFEINSRKALLLPIEFEIIHTEKERDDNDNETSVVVSPGKNVLLRDEIADLRIKVSQVSTAGWDMKLDIEPADMKTATLGARGAVQMYDFGKVDNGTVTPLTTNTNGTTKAGPYDIKVKNDQETFKIVVNKAGKFRIKLKSVDNQVDVTSQEFTVTNRIRKYATREHANQRESNDFDKSFENSANWWADWEIGDTSGNYTFKDSGQRYTPELLKAIAWKECDLHPANAAAHGTNKFDIMQVNAGNRPGSDDMSGSSALADWNERAPRVEVEVLIDGAYQKRQFYLFESDPPSGVAANDFSVRKMRYPASGLQPIGSYRESIKWSLRKLLYKQYNLAASDFAVTYRVKGAGDTLFGVKKPDLRTLDETVRRYGDITAQYPIHVFRMRDEGIATRGSGDEYRWPRLTNDKARH